MPKTIHDMAFSDRPREKLIKYGPEKLTNEELLAIILRTGRKGKNVIQLSKEILQKLGDKIKNPKISDISSINGIGNAKASEIIASIELGKRVLKNKKSQIYMNAKDVWENLLEIRKSKKEHFVILFLDARNQEIKKEIISIGTISSSLVHPREVFEPAIKYSASGIILAHNHPSDEVKPSLADIKVTEQLIHAGKILDIDVLDHVIVSENKFFSFSDNGLLKGSRL